MCAGALLLLAFGGLAATALAASPRERQYGNTVTRENPPPVVRRPQGSPPTRLPFSGFQVTLLFLAGACAVTTGLTLRLAGREGRLPDVLPSDTPQSPPNDEAVPPAASRAGDVQRHFLFVPAVDGFSMIELRGPPPAAGVEITLPGVAGRFAVAKLAAVGAAPCAYLQRVPAAGPGDVDRATTAAEDAHVEL